MTGIVFSVTLIVAIAVALFTMWLTEDWEDLYSVLTTVAVGCGVGILVLGMFIGAEPITTSTYQGVIVGTLDDELAVRLDDDDTILAVGLSTEEMLGLELGQKIKVTCKESGWDFSADECWLGEAE